MSGRFVRASKYRHVLGQASKKELCYENLKVTKNAWDSNLIKANSKYIAVNWASSGGGAFAVIPLEETGKAPDKVSLFRGHTATILDVDFNPFDEQMIVSSSDDGRIAVWKIPADYSFHHNLDDEGEVVDVEPERYLTGHTRKVGHVKFHPLAANVLASSSLDYTVKLWDLTTDKDVVTLPHKDLVTSFEFSPNGALLATTCKDKVIRVWDLATQTVVAEGPGHSGAKPLRVCWLSGDRIATTGFSRMSDRQVGIYDTADLSKPIGGYINIDSSSGVLMPIYDACTKILFLAGKGDGNIRYYEFADDDLFELSAFQSTNAQRGFALAPKYAVNVRENEIVRAYKTVSDSFIEPISFVVPRRAEMFQGDIYPDCPSRVPALSAKEFFEGKTVEGPVLMSMQSLYDGSEPSLRASSVEVKVPTPEPSAKAVVVELTREITPVKPSSVDELLKKDEVDVLLQKAEEMDSDKDQSEGEWESVEPQREATPVVVVKKPVEASKTPVATLPRSTPPPAALEVVSPPAEPQTPTTKSLPVSAPASTASGASAPAASTLKGNVERLGTLVSLLEAQVALLTEAAVSKDARLEALEAVIAQLVAKLA